MPLVVITSSSSSGLTTLIATISDAGAVAEPFRLMPRTPIAPRPVGRRSVSRNRQAMPCAEDSRISCAPSVNLASIRSSPSSSVMAMMPLRRRFLKARNSVFFTVPFLVAMTMYRPSTSTSVTGIMARTRSSGCSCRRLTRALPWLSRPPSGISYAFSQCIRPLLVKNRMMSCVQQVSSIST